MKRLTIVFAFLILSIHLSVYSQTNENSETSNPPKSVSDETEPKPKTEVQFQYSREQLSKNYGTWESFSLYAQRKINNRQTIWGMYRISNRNGFRDTEFVAGTYKKLPRKWAITSEAMYSPSNQYVGKYSVMGEVEKVVKRNYVIHAGTRFTAYRTIKATTAYGLVETYWGSNRAAYTLSLTQLTNAGTTPSHRIQYNRYFGENLNNIGATVSFGREHESLGPNVGIQRTNTWSIATSGKYWVNSKIGFNFTGSYHKQGNIYSRRGVNFGVSYRF
jgi:YaiO family outer membrane protein